MKWINLTSAILLIFIMISCNKNGEHRTFFCDKNTQINLGGAATLQTINKDSIQTETIRKHDSISLKEHRVYYVDYSRSMVLGDNKNVDDTLKSKANVDKNDSCTLLKAVQKCLKKSIREIEGEDVTIEIIPFLDAALWKNEEPQSIFKIVKKKSFDANALKEMDAFIDNIKERRKPNGGDYNTHHSIVIKDFLENRIKNDRQYHMMILLTDGDDEYHKDKLVSGRSVLLNRWEECTRGKYVFGVFANLPSDIIRAKDGFDDLAECFIGKRNNDSRRFLKMGLDFDFNIFVMPSPKQPVEHRTNPTIQIPIAGSIPEFTPIIQEDEHYRYTLKQPDRSSKYIEIKVDTITPAEERPNIHKTKLQYHLEPRNKKANSHFFPSDSTIELTIIDKKTPNIGLWIANHTNDTLPCVSQKLRYCKKLFGVVNPEWSDTITIRISYEKSNDAKSKEEFNKIKLTVSDIPEYAKLISKSEIDLDKPSDTVSITFALDPSNAKLIDDQMLEGCIKITGTDSLKAIFVNNSPLSQISSANTIGLFKVKAVERCHPLLVFLFWLFTILLGLWLIAMAGILVWRNKRPHFMNNIDALQLETKPQNMGANYILFTNSQLGLTTLLPLPKDKTKFICCVRFDVNCKCHEKKEWGLCNWWKLNIAFSGDIYIYPLTPNPNKFNIKTIELKPSSDSNKIEIWINGKKTRDISQRNIPYKIASCQGVLLNVKAIRQPVIN